MSRALEKTSDNQEAAWLFWKQLYQVLRSYFLQWHSWVITAIWLLLIFFWSWLCRLRPNLGVSGRLADCMAVPIIANVVLSIIIGHKLRSQFCNPRARLLPGFAKPHLVAAGTILSAAIILETALFPYLGNISAQLAVVNLIFLAMIISVWFCYMMGLFGIWLLVFIQFEIGSSSGKFVTEFIQTVGDSLFLSVSLTCISLALTAAFIIRLCRISEETPEFSRVPFDWNSNISLHNANQRRRKRAAHVFADTRYQVRLLDRLFSLAFRKPTALSPWRHLVLRQVATGFHGLTWIPVQAGIVICLFWFSSWSGNTHDEKMAVFWSLFMPFFIAMSLWSGIWRSRWPYLSQELLLPMGRKGFIRNMTRSSAIDMAALFVGHGLGYLLTLALFHAPKPLVEILPYWFVLAAVQYALGYCLMLWLASFRDYWVYLIGTSIIAVLLAILDAMAVSVVSGTMISWEPADKWLILLLTFAIAMVMTIFYRSAFRRWCQIELEMHHG